MWWPTQARPPLATQKVFFSSAPQARIGASRPGAAARCCAARSRASGASAAASSEIRRVERPRQPSRRCGCGSAGRGRGRRRRSRPAASRIVVAEGDRLVGDVARGHHQRRSRRRPAAGGGVGCRGASRRGRGCAARPRPRRRPPRAAGDHDGAFRARSSSASSAALSSTSAARGLEVGGHQRERLVLAVLARAQRRHRGLVVCPAREVVAAEALHREDRAGARAAPAAARPGRPSSARPDAPAARSRGQAFGCAWKRRSRGSSYSARQASHISERRPSSSAAGRRGPRGRS